MREEAEGRALVKRPGDPGPFPARDHHRSGHARLTHPAPHVMVCYATSALVADGGFGKRKPLR